MRAADAILVLAAGIAAIALAACTAAATATTAPPAAPTLSVPPSERPPSAAVATTVATPAAPTVATTAATMPAATASPASGRVLVSGTQDCGIEDASDETQGQVTMTKGTLICTDTMSDPRVSGRHQSQVTLVYADLPNLEVDRWATKNDLLTNDGGTWRGTGWGSEFWDDQGGLRTSGTALYVGEGGYDGLVYRVFIAQSPEWKASGYIMAGWIEPAK